MNASTPEEYLVDTGRIFLNSVALKMSDIVQQHNFEEINIDYPEAEGYYVVHFISIPYTLYY